VASVPLKWRKSSYCAGGECIEVSGSDGQVLVRNSGMPELVLRYTTDEWLAFARGMKAGEFDDIFVS
jgi:Domain of unknown function (DUF397)